MEAFGGAGPAIPQFGAWDEQDTKKPRRGGGGGAGREQQDALKKYMQALQLKRESLALDRDTVAVYAALKDGVDNYTQAQIDGAVAATAEYRILQEELKTQETLWNHVGSEFESGFASIIDGTESVEDAFTKMAKTIVDELFRVLVLQRAIGAVGVGVGVGVGGGGGSGLLGLLGGLVPFAKGDAFTDGNIVPFAKGTVIDKTAYFPMANGDTGMMAEDDPEAIMPLTRTSNGDLGVKAVMPSLPEWLPVPTTPDVSPVVNVSVQNYSGQAVEVLQDEDQIRVIVGRAVQASQNDFARSMASGQGPYARALEGSYRSRRKAS